MTASLFDRHGRRKYLTARERRAFVGAARQLGGEIGTFCLTIAVTGARISEILALTLERVDENNSALVIETLKRRKRGMYRAVPVPSWLITMLMDVHGTRNANDRLWRWCRTTGWKHVKRVMRQAKVGPALAMPKSARHAFGVGAIESAVPLNIVQRWMGHARIETTAIYTDVIGDEERRLARRSWKILGHSSSKSRNPRA